MIYNSKYANSGSKSNSSNIAFYHELPHIFYLWKKLLFNLDLILLKSLPSLTILEGKPTFGGQISYL